MKVKLLHDLERVVEGQQPVVSRKRWTISREATPLDSVILPVALKTRYKIVLHFQTLASPNLSDQEIRHVERNARRAMAYGIYGQVEEEIRKTLYELWEDGLNQHPAADRLEKLVRALRGEEVEDDE